MLKVGDKVPDFEVPMATPDGVQQFKLADVLGGGDVVLAFYPIAFSGVCTKEVCETRDSLAFFEHVGARAFGFSVDTPHANAAFAREHKLSFPLLSDANHDVIGKLWETQTVAGVKDRAKRGVIAFGGDGVVKYVWSTDSPGEWGGLDELKAKLHEGHHH